MGAAATKSGWRSWFLAAIPLGIALLCGCSWTDRHGTHHLILGLGFGIVTSTNDVGVEVRDMRVLGAVVGPEGFGAGYVQRHRVVINPALSSNVILSVRATPCSLTVSNISINDSQLKDIEPSKPTTKP